MITDKIPEALTERKQWCLWKTVTKGDRPTKIPFQANGAEAKSNDPATWTTFDLARDAFYGGQFDGLGYVFAQEDPFIGIDLDGCRDPVTGKVSEWARKIIQDFGTYAEVSPSKTGVKLFGIGRSPFPTGKKKELPDEPKVCDKSPAIEVYDRLRYFAVTGYRLASLATIPVECQAQVDALCAKYWPQVVTPATSSAGPTTDVMERARAYVAKMPPAISGSGGHTAAFKVACVLVLGFGLDESQARQVFQEYNQRCDPPWSDREIEHKLRSAAGQPGQRNYLRDAVAEQFDRIKLPKYEWKFEREMRVTTLKEAALAYLAKIREDGHKLLEIGLPELDYSLAGGMEFGEMAIIGGRPGHGKSVFGLQAIHTSSLAGYPCLMISEEMSALALGKRTIQYASEVPEEFWRHRQDVDEHIERHFALRAPVLIAEGCATTDRACKAIEQAVKRDGVRVVAVDYMQLLKGFGKDRFEQITQTSVALRQLANEHKILLIALVQLNREIEKRNKFIPVVSDIRECGQIEQDADAVVFVVWPHRINQNNPPHEYSFYVAKNRNRAINQASFKCRFEPSRQRFVECKQTTASDYFDAIPSREPGSEG